MDFRLLCHGFLVKGTTTVDSRICQVRIPVILGGLDFRTTKMIIFWIEKGRRNHRSG
jgi:hypothetical protein